MISIIGGGPAGSYLAYLLAKAGKRVEVFEEHDQIGLPLQCTGIVTSAFTDIIPLRRQFVVNKINKVRLFAPNGKHIDFHFSKPNIILDRARFDQYLAERAKDFGVSYHLGHKFIDNKKNKIILEARGARTSKATDILVGADGPISAVARANKLYKNKKRQFIVGLQARVNLKTDPNMIEFWFGPNYGTGAWVVPESAFVARVGVGVYMDGKTNPNTCLKRFLNKRAPKCKVRDYHSGLIPIYNTRVQTQNKKKNVFLVGDAAGQVKPTTFGGIMQGLMAAQELSKAIIKKKNYGRLCKKRLGKDFMYSLLIRRVANKFSAKDWNELIKLLNNKRCRTLIGRYDRDFPSKFIIKLVLLAQPRLLKFGLKALKR